MILQKLNQRNEHLTRNENESKTITLRGDKTKISFFCYLRVADAKHLTFLAAAAFANVFTLPANIRAKLAIINDFFLGYNENKKKLI